MTADAAALVATVGLRIEYLRTAGAPRLLSDDTHTVPDTGGNLSTEVDISACLADPAHAGQADECRVNVAVSVTAISGTVASQTVGPLSLRPDQVATLPSLTFDLSGPTVAIVRVTPALDSLVVGDTTLFTAQAFDSAGNVLSGQVFTWVSGNPGIVALSTVNPTTARAVGVAAGSAAVVASASGVSDTATVVVSDPQLQPVASVVVTPALDSLLLGDTTFFSAQAFDSAGNVLAGRVVTWVSGDTSLVAVSVVDSITARAIGVGVGSAGVIATVGQVADTATAVVSARPPSLVGNWFAGPPTILDAGMLAFLNDSIYMLVADGMDPPNDPDPGQPGIERGRYSWGNNGTRSGALTTTVLTSTVGSWGLGTGTVATATVSVNGDTILLQHPDGPDTALRVRASPTNPLVGTWVLEDPFNPARVLVLGIIDDTHFFLGVDDNADATGGPGMERGTYTWNAATGAFSANATTDTNGDRGLNPTQTTGTLTLSGNTLTYISALGPLVLVRLP